MQIRNPCKKCLVQPMCRSACNGWYNYKYWSSKLRDWAGSTILLLIGVELSLFLTERIETNGGRAISIILFSLSILQFWFIYNYKKILKHQINRFNQGDVTFKFNIKPKPSSSASFISKSGK